MAYNMKGSPFQRNFGIGSPAKKHVDAHTSKLSNAEYDAQKRAHENKVEEEMAVKSADAADKIRKEERRGTKSIQFTLAKEGKRRPIEKKGDEKVEEQKPVSAPDNSKPLPDPETEKKKEPVELTRKDVRKAKKDYRNRKIQSKREAKIKHWENKNR